MCEMKTCSKCEESKPVSPDFWYFSRKTGKPENAICKTCRAVIARVRYERDREKILARTSEYQRNNKDKQKIYHQTYKSKNPEAFKERRRKAAAKHRSTPSGRLANLIQTAVWHALRDSGLKKQARLVDLVGWTIDDLKAHLEERFEVGMTFDNVGEWHIDHVMPISTFKVDSAGSVEFRKMWALDNLAPLWARDNMQKKNDPYWQLPDVYENALLRKMYPKPVDIITFFNIDRDKLKQMGYEAIRVGSYVESADSGSVGALHSL